MKRAAVTYEVQYRHPEDEEWQVYAERADLDCARDELRRTLREEPLAKGERIRIVRVRTVTTETRRVVSPGKKPSAASTSVQREGR